MSLSEQQLAEIENAISNPESPLSLSLNGLGACSEGRGTCLMIECDGDGETLIADANWKHGRNETINICNNVAIVDLQQGFGFKRLAILMEPSENDGPTNVQGFSVADAALGVAEELAKIAKSWLKVSKVPVAGGLSSVNAA